MMQVYFSVRLLIRFILRGCFFFSFKVPSASLFPFYVLNSLVKERSLQEIILGQLFV